ncbi:MAG: type II toxin-antitoxin system MqsA family antitoxin [Dehalococcoidia bacterium]
MRCHICKHGETPPGETTVVLERGESVIVVGGVPAEVCDTCDEAYVAEDVSAVVFRLAEAAVARGAEVEVPRYAA